MIILSREKNAYYNLAVEKLLLSGVLSCPTLFLWQSQNAVIIGAHQNPYAECNLQLMHENGVQLARRISGGGAVYHDGGNLNFCFISPTPCDKKSNFEIVLSALNNFGISAEFTGRNDIVISGFKVSGSAYYNGNKFCMHHGTLLINSNLNKLSKYLTPPKEKLLKNGVKSVKSRVANLTQFNSEITVEKIKEQIISSFKEKVGECDIVFANVFFNQEEIKNEMEKISSNEYLYSKWSTFKAKVKKRFDWGFCSVDFSIDRSGKISEIIIESDTMFAECIPLIEKQLLNVNPKEFLLPDIQDDKHSLMINSVLSLIKENYDK